MSKYYAVVKGTKPGIYTTWTECSKQVTGVSGSIFKSFPTKKEAEEYMTLDGVEIPKILPPAPCNSPINSPPVKTRSASKKSTKCIIYTDGSHIKGTSKMGGGAFCRWNDVEYEFSFACTPSTLTKYGIDESLFTKVSNPTMEFIAFAEVLDRIYSAKCHAKYSFVFYIDYQGVEAWMSGKWQCKEDYIRKIRDFCLERVDKMSNSISIEYVPSKSDEGNLNADALAKSGKDSDNFIELFKLLRE